MNEHIKKRCNTNVIVCFYPETQAACHTWLSAITEEDEEDDEEENILRRAISFEGTGSVM